jgi:hypothetical protein
MEAESQMSLLVARQLQMRPALTHSKRTQILGFR